MPSNQPTEPNFGSVARLGVISIVCLTTTILAALATRQFVGYDSFWHVFISRQETWGAFWQEVRENAHPPLFYLLLGLSTDLFGLSLLSYRLVPMLGTVAATLFIVRIVWQLTRQSGVAVVAGAAFGLSYNAIVMGLEVRAYSLGVALILAALSIYIDWVDSWPKEISRWKLIAFALVTAAALATSYQALFFLPAIVVIPILLVALDCPSLREVVARTTRYARDAYLLFGLPFLTLLVLYFAHMRLWDRALTHVPSLMFDPAQDPSAMNFLERRSEALAALFIPRIRDISAGTIAAATAAVVTCLTVVKAQHKLVTSVPLVMLFVMLGMNMAAALQRRYPFGGELRHEFFLFPFMVVSAFVAVAPTRLRVRLPSMASALWTLFLTSLVTLNLMSWLSTFPLHSHTLLQDQMDRFRSLFGLPAAISVDQYNFMTIFSHHHDWDWKLEEQDVTTTLRQIWRVSNKDTQFFVCRQREWQLDLSQETFYRDLLACAAQTHSDRVTVFRPQQEGFRPTWNTGTAEVLAKQLAAPVGLEPEQIIVQDWDVYASFRRLSRK